MKTAIFIFSQPNNSSKLKTCLYFLFKKFNYKYKHPVIILGNFEKQLQNDILDGIRQESKSLVSFKNIHLKIPEYIDKDKLHTCIEHQPTNSWGNIDDRNIEQFWLTDFWTDFAKEYDYVMKLDDDFYFEEPLNNDLFNTMDNRANNLLFCILEEVCAIESFGMKEFFSTNFNKKELIDQCVISTKISDPKTVQKVKAIYKTIYNKDYPKDELDVSQPRVVKPCFMILRTSFFTSDTITPYINKIKELGYIYYFKWKTSAIYSLLAMMINENKVIRSSFQMSIEEFRTGKLVPSKYTQTGCVTSK